MKLSIPTTHTFLTFFLFITNCIILSHGYVIKKWPLYNDLPIDLHIDGSAAGPNGTAMCIGWDTSTCHDPDVSCNQCRSNEPHVFHITWCADTTGYIGISCDLDLGYRSPEGAREGHFSYSLAGLASKDSDFRNASTVVFPDSPYNTQNF